MKNLLAFKIDIGESFWIKDNVGIGSDQAKKAGFGSIGEILSNLLNNVYVLAGVILFILLIVGGFMFMIGAGQENPEKAKKGKQAITAALIGFAVIFCSYWIIRIIEIITAVNILSPNPAL